MENSRASLQLLLNVSRELAGTLDLRAVLVRVLTLSAQSLGAERGSLVVLDDSQKPTDAAIVINGTVHTQTLDQLRVVVQQGLAGWVVRNLQPALLSDTSKDERWLMRPDDAEGASGPKSAICIPLISRGSLVGILTLVHPQVDFFTTEHLDLLQAIGDLAAMAIYNARLYESLGQAHARYYQLFEGSIDPVFITTKNGALLEVNRKAADVICYNPAESPQRDITQIHTIDWMKVGEGFSLVTSDTPVIYETVLHCSQGSELPAEVFVQTIEVEGQPCFLWIFHDISGRKELDRMREDLAAMIYHDLRSPLANIISSLDILSAMLPQDGPAALKSVMQIATRSTDRMQRLIFSLLDINRLEDGQPLANKRSVNPAELIGEAVDTIQPACESRQQSMNVRLVSPLPTIMADADMLRRVVINLLENATKFTPLGGSIEVGAQAEKSNVRFWVKDTGPGIPAEAQERIFDKFTRLQTERAPKGLGLGLAFCRLAVQAHGGKIWVESRVGEGSTFIIEIPAESA